MILVKAFQMCLPAAFGKESFRNTTSKVSRRLTYVQGGRCVKRTGRCQLYAPQPANYQFDFRRHPRVSPTTTGALGGCASPSDILITNAPQVLLGFWSLPERLKLRV